MVSYGDAVACVAGGAESAITPLATAAFAEMGATSESGISRPFDRRRDGFVMGEGAGVHGPRGRRDRRASRRTDPRIRDRLRRHRRRAPHDRARAERGGRRPRDPQGARRRGIEPGELAYVNAHGTSTPLNDRSETEALKAALGEQAARIPTSSTKSAIGHLLGAAGAVEAVATLQALRAKQAPPTLNYEEPDEGLDLDYVPGEAKALPLTATRPSGSATRSGSAGTMPCSASRRLLEAGPGDTRSSRPPHGCGSDPATPSPHSSGSRPSATRDRSSWSAPGSPLARRDRAPGRRRRRRRGQVGGRPVYCYAQDQSFAGGSLGTAQAEMIVRVLDLAGRAGARWSASSPPAAPGSTRARARSAATGGSSASTSRSRAAFRRSA